jgi:hypothetical protein
MERPQRYVIQPAGDIVTAERFCRRVERPLYSVIQLAGDIVTAE